MLALLSWFRSVIRLKISACNWEKTISMLTAVLPVSALAIASSEGRRWQLMARFAGCCETSPLSSSVILAAVELMVQLLLSFPLLQSLEERAETIHVVLKSWASLTVSP